MIKRAANISPFEKLWLTKMGDEAVTQIDEGGGSEAVTQIDEGTFPSVLEEYKWQETATHNPELPEHTQGQRIAKKFRTLLRDTMTHHEREKLFAEFLVQENLLTKEEAKQISLAARPPPFAPKSQRR